MPDIQYTINGQIAKGSLSQSFAASRRNSQHGHGRRRGRDARAGHDH
jgi:hypothetical protein